MFQCERCLHNFDLKSQLKTHLNKKYTCEVSKKGQNINGKELLSKLYPAKDFVCECNKQYSTKQTLKRHKKTCTYDIEIVEEPISPVEEKITDLDDKDEMILFLKEKLRKNEEDFEKRLLIMEKQINQGINIGTNNNTNSNNTSINITLNNYGSENEDYITPQVLEKIILENPTYGCVRLSALMHLNDNHPENQNIKLKNIRGEYISVFKNGKWQLEDKTEVLRNMWDEKQDKLLCHFDKNEDYFREKYPTKSKRFMDSNDLIQEGDSNVIKTIKKDLTKELYNYFAP